MDMALTFYPHSDDVKGTLDEKIEVLMEAAERYKAAILDVAVTVEVEGATARRLTPRELTVAYNWEEIARVLREIRELSEADKGEKIRKGNFLAKLAEVYEVLRAAKMSKLEAVRLALISEANQLRGGGGASQVA
jgi:hypothetical protein